MCVCERDLNDPEYITEGTVCLPHTSLLISIKSPNSRVGETGTLSSDSGRPFLLKPQGTEPTLVKAESGSLLKPQWSKKGNALSAQTYRVGP